MLDELEREGRRPKLIYTIPNFQNPGGVTMSLERRKRLVALARDARAAGARGQPLRPAPLRGRAAAHALLARRLHDGRGGASDFVIYLGTFSKILSPGVRLGWAVAPRPVLEKLNLGKQGADLCSASVTQLFVSTYFEERGAGGGPGVARLPRPAPGRSTARAAT